MPNLKLTRKAKRSLRRKRTLTASVRTTFTPKGGGAATTVTAKLRLKR